ncbi:MAG: hypothetical protein IKD28_03080, partial [Clostridia bacterium]|nr:hypothetical protein [Clostridia bacterium]
MDENRAYYHKKVVLRMRMYALLYILAYVIVFFIRKANYNLRDTEEELKIAGLFFAILAGTYLLLMFFRWIGFMGKPGMVLALLSFFPISLIFFWPIVKYHNGGEGILPERDRVFDATVKAYQKVWKKQCFAQRVLLPLLYIGIIALVGWLISFISTNFPDAFIWVALFIVVCVYMLTLAMLGGITPVQKTTTSYSVSVGQGWLDYGQVYVSETGSVTKDDYHISFLAVILAFPLTWVVLVGIFVAILAFIAVNLLRMILPFTGKRTIYLHKKTRVHPYYACGPDFLKGIVNGLNRGLGFLFRINLVSDEFWQDGVGPNYI